jgi:hypothetical protein
MLLVVVRTAVVIRGAAMSSFFGRRSNRKRGDQVRLGIHQNIRAYSRLVHDRLSLVTIIVGGQAGTGRGMIRSREVVRYLSWKLTSKRVVDILGRGRVISGARFAITVPRSRDVRGLAGPHLSSILSLSLLGNIRGSSIWHVLILGWGVIFIVVLMVIVDGRSALGPIVPSGLRSHVA